MRIKALLAPFECGNQNKQQAHNINAQKQVKVNKKIREENVQTPLKCKTKAKTRLSALKNNNCLFVPKEPWRNEGRGVLRRWKHS